MSSLRRSCSWPGAVALTLALALGACTGDVEGWVNVEPDVPDGDRASADAPDLVAPVDDAIVVAGRDVVVDRVVDGDSLEVVAGGDSIELRLEGFNAPELYAETADGGADQMTCNGTAAKQATKVIIEAAEGPVVLIENGSDRYGRTLGDLVVGGVSLTSSLVAQGEGLATGDSADRREQMKSAADQGLGIWSDRCADGETLELRIGRYQVDAPGNDRFNLIDEWVEVVNKSDSTVSVDSWVLRDDTTGHRFTLSGLLEPGRIITVRSGGDPADSTVDTSTSGGDQTLYLGESFPVWSNSGETIILTDPNGSFVDWRFVEPE